MTLDDFREAQAIKVGEMGAGEPCGEAQLGQSGLVNGG